MLIHKYFKDTTYILHVYALPVLLSDYTYVTLILEGAGLLVAIISLFLLFVLVCIHSCSNRLSLTIVNGLLDFVAGNLQQRHIYVHRHAHQMLLLQLFDLMPGIIYHGSLCRNWCE